MTTPLPPFREPIRATLTRTLAIAIVLGAVVSQWWGGLNRWPLATLVMLWPSLGGHFVELWFLNWLRPRLPMSPSLHFMVRFGVWFVGGALIGLGMLATARSLAGFRPTHTLPWWIAGLGFIGVELSAHLMLLFRGQPNVFHPRR